MEQRKAHRVVFERGFAANMMAIDGTWRRPCTMQDVSETGARLSVGGSIEGLPLKEFFLVLSTVGKAYRRCQLAWVNGDQVGVLLARHRFARTMSFDELNPRALLDAVNRLLDGTTRLAAPPPLGGEDGFVAVIDSLLGDASLERNV